MNKGLLVYTGLLTLFTIYTIHKYEDAIKQYKDSIEDYKRALNYARNTKNGDHDAWLQVEHIKLKKDYAEMSDLANQYKNLWDKAEDSARCLLREIKGFEKAANSEMANNQALQAKIKSMQEELGYLRNVKDGAGIQYESHTYKSNTYDASNYEKIIEL
jgi:chromosome segregation ATPase